MYVNNICKEESLFFRFGIKTYSIMKRAIQIIFQFVLIFILISSSVYGQNGKKVFIMVHFEAGRDSGFYAFQDILNNELDYPLDSMVTNNLYFQEATWPATVNLVQTADTFNIKLTLALQSQMAEYILQDIDKINTVEGWMNNGHEFAIHHHGINHVDWGGYTNRFQGTPYSDDNLWEDKFINSGLYRGDMQEGFDYSQQLASATNTNIVSGCITDTQIDKPDEIIYLTEGGDPTDLISTPDTLNLPNQTIYFLNHCQLTTVFKDDDGELIEDDTINYQLTIDRLNLIKDSLNYVGDNEFMGIVLHAFDYYRFPSVYSDLFAFLNENQVSSKSIKDFMNETVMSIEDDTKSNNDNIKIYPNPTSGIIKVVGESVNYIEILNTSGNVIRQLRTSDNTTQINLEEYSKGVYFIKTHTNSGIAVRKIVLTEL